MTTPTSVLIAHTHREWFDNLSRLGGYGAGQPVRLDEINFWSPNTTRPIKRFTVGEPVFFRLGAPDRAVAGYGFFAHHLEADVRLAWSLFGPKNGAPTLSELARILGRNTVADLHRPLGCMLLRDATFWPEWRWIPWPASRGYANTGVQRGRTDDDPVNVALLMGQIEADGVSTPAELAPRFTLLQDDARRVELGRQVVREGQGTFRARLLEAYGAQCAVTREHTEPVLDAAHIQRYLGPASNHPQNGLLLTQEFHTLFDRGLVCVEPRGDALRLRVSHLLQERWNNGRRYREYDDRSLHLPVDPELRPSLDALAWHRDTIYEQVA